MINGIQHIGIGVKSRDESFYFYNNALGFSVPLSRHTGNCYGMIPVIEKDETRNVTISMNPYGGGLVEIFQYTSKIPLPVPDEIDFSYSGFLFYGLKVRNIARSLKIIENFGGKIITHSTSFTPMKNYSWKTGLFRDPDGIHGMMLEYPDSNTGYGNGSPRIGGIEYVSIGVSNLDRSIDFYSNILGYNDIVYQCEGSYPEWECIFGKGRKLKRALLKRGAKPQGIFRHFLKGGMIELIEVESNRGKHNFVGRKWGDIGFMELCFDVSDISSTLDMVTKKGAQIIVPPYIQDMGMNTKATFAYIKDPDGSMLEFADIESLPAPYFLIRMFVNPSIIGMAKKLSLLK